MKRVLSIDGGGIRGIRPAVWLAAFSKAVGKPIAACFDMIAGTSTGGILACCYGVPFPASQIAGFYQAEGPKIFCGPTIAHWPFKPKYPSGPVEEVLKRYFGYRMLSSTVAEILVCAYDMARAQPKVFKTWQAKADASSDIELWKVARATSAATTYFPEEEPGWADGGVYAANPSVCAIAEAARLWPGEEVYLLSIGTGAAPHKFSYEETKDWGVAQWAVPISGLLLDAGEQAVDYICGQLLPADRYVRIQFDASTASGAMDDASKENLAALEWSAEECVKTTDFAALAVKLKLI